MWLSRRRILHSGRLFQTFNRTQEACGKRVRNCARAPRKKAGSDRNGSLPASYFSLLASLLSAARRGSAVADADPAVDRLHVNRGPAVAEVGVEMILDLTLNRDREVHRDAAVHRRRFQMRGVVGRHPQVDTAVHRFRVQSLAMPGIASQRDVQSAVHRAPLDVTGEVAQVDAAIGRVEADLPVHPAQYNSAVHRMQISSEVVWHPKPLIHGISAAAEERLGTMIANIAPLRIDRYLVQDLPGCGFRSAPGFYPRFQSHIGAVFT